jgi:hypothetical protein
MLGCTEMLHLTLSEEDLSMVIYLSLLFDCFP